jgi:hypothetical protein
MHPHHLNGFDGEGVAMQTALQAGLIGPNVGKAWNPRGPLNGFGEVDQNGNYIPGTDPSNWDVVPQNYITQDPSAPYVAPSGGVVVPPPAADGSGKASTVDWTQIFVAGEKLAAGIVQAVVAGSTPSVGGSCQAGYIWNPKAGVCMTQAAYAAWLQTQKGGGGMSSTTTMILVGGAVLVGLALFMGKRRGGAMAGFGRWHKRRRVRRARR